MTEDRKYFVGIDIGSTASKVAVLCDGAIIEAFVLPTGWNGLETARHIYGVLEKKGYAESMRCTATGYGRVSVDYADKVITEITCHGKGGWALFVKNGTIVDIGGQDTLYLTGGLCNSPYFLQILSQKTNTQVTTHPMARYAGALGAALAAAKQKCIDWSRSNL